MIKSRHPVNYVIKLMVFNGLLAFVLEMCVLQDRNQQICQKLTSRAMNVL